MKKVKPIDINSFNIIEKVNEVIDALNKLTVFTTGFQGNIKTMITKEELKSNCCQAPVIGERDFICSECGEHCVASK